MSGLGESHQSYAEALLGHYSRHWGEPHRRQTLQRGPVEELPAGFAVYQFRSGDVWRFATVGAGIVGGIEFFLVTTHPTEHHVQTLTVVAHFAATGAEVGIDHTLNLGEPWLPGSLCDHLLVSRPYLDGPGLEVFGHQNAAITCAWLLPITKAEREFKIRHGSVALETLFERRGIEYANPGRACLVG